MPHHLAFFRAPGWVDHRSLAAAQPLAIVHPCSPPHLLTVQPAMCGSLAWPGRRTTWSCRRRRARGRHVAGLGREEGCCGAARHACSRPAERPIVLFPPNPQHLANPCPLQTYALDAPDEQDGEPASGGARAPPLALSAYPHQCSIKVSYFEQASAVGRHAGGCLARLQSIVSGTKRHIQRYHPPACCNPLPCVCFSSPVHSLCRSPWALPA